MKFSLNKFNFINKFYVKVNVFEDTFVLPSSSGTTGLPKCVMLTNASIATNILQVLQPGTLELRRATS